ncbi:hypothetical protein JDW15_04940 [Aerococcaceae bacterium zg-ZJ1578]|uniref:hypothetical protein n=1 Tax=Aerococcaceae bacterium zg-252 TaxID=2796928 RepID=UPI001A2F7D74|nr:hypothetical protein [Aerococcaceae bacterium zg-1578]
MGKFLKFALLALLLGTITTQETVNAARTVCTDWIIYRTVNNCDRSSGLCTWNNWGHTNFKTDYKKRSCTNTSGRQYFEYTQTTYAKGCC